MFLYSTMCPLFSVLHFFSLTLNSSNVRQHLCPRQHCLLLIHSAWQLGIPMVNCLRCQRGEKAGSEWKQCDLAVQAAVVFTENISSRKWSAVSLSSHILSLQSLNPPLCMLLRNKSSYRHNSRHSGSSARPIEIIYEQFCVCVCVCVRAYGRDKKNKKPRETMEKKRVYRRFNVMLLY